MPEVRWAWVGRLLRVSQGQNQGVILAGNWGRIHSQAHSGCWPTSVPRGCRTVVSISFLAVSRGWSLSLEAPCIPSHVFHVAPSSNSK